MISTPLTPVMHNYMSCTHESAMQQNHHSVRQHRDPENSLQAQIMNYNWIA